LHETRRLALHGEEEGHSDRKTSHAGIIRIGFEGISQPHIVEHPCFVYTIETLLAGSLQMAGMLAGMFPGCELRHIPD
jgi:hypothetical protein